MLSSKARKSTSISASVKTSFATAKQVTQRVIMQLSASPCMSTFIPHTSKGGVATVAAIMEAGTRCSYVLASFVYRASEKS